MVGKLKNRMADCHPERRHAAKGLCASCYQGQYTRAHKDDPDKPYLNVKRYGYWRRWADKNPGASHRHEAGINREKMEAMLTEQGGVCAICGHERDGNGRWTVDHDHRSGIIRGILCHRCNAGLGCFDDDIGSLQRAIAYLDYWQARTPAETVQARPPKRRGVKARINDACGHVDRTHYGHGKCLPCWAKARKGALK